MFASKAKGYNAIRNLFDGGHDLASDLGHNVVTVDFNTCAAAPTAARPVSLRLGLGL
jgi:predicted Co/Zn/Cd cation transporter (cation efflux family)